MGFIKNLLRKIICPNCPILTVKESKEFHKKVEECLKSPVGYVSTPKIDEAIKKILRDYGDTSSIGLIEKINDIK